MILATSIGSRTRMCFHALRTLFILCLSVAATRFAAAQLLTEQTAETHKDRACLPPYFRNCSAIRPIQPGNAAPPAEESEWPDCIELVLDDGKSRLESDSVIPPLRFVLVRAAQQTCHGLTFVAQTDFYIATDELSNVQLAAILCQWTRSRFRTYDLFASMRLAAARSNPDIATDDLPSYKRYLAKRDHPALLASVSEADLICEIMRHRLGLVVRSPTIGEWLCAMRAGAKTRFWWGEHAKIENMTWRGWTPGADTADVLVPVSTGVENAFGLRNTVGNAAELVVPSDEERSMLKRTVGLFAAESECTSPDATISSHGGIPLGGGADTAAAGDTPFAIERYEAAFDDWCDILCFQQCEAAPVWKGSTSWCTGYRLVIELPPTK